jgi:predicted aspartyl protease
MPIIHIQYSGQGLTPDGKPVQIDPRQLIAMRGPVVSVAIKVPPEIAELLNRQSKPVPPPISGFGLIDTGATSSCIDHAAAQTLGLPVVNVIKMASATHEAVDSNVYPISFDILGGQPITVNCPRAAGAALANQGLVLLMGRDLLANSYFTYNGPTGQFTICF